MYQVFKSTFRYCVTYFIVVLFISCAANAQSLEQPLVRIGKTISAPVIDGNLDDAAWKDSVLVSGFSNVGQKTPASQQTQVRIVYDAQNLYVSWRVDESLLVIAQQRMHEVKTTAEKLDENVLDDDSVVLFLQPGHDAKMREFVINSIGTLFDAQSDRNDLWKSRDASWNSNAKVAAIQQDGYWTAEIAIPWTAFGQNDPPTAGASWAVGLARNAVARSERSVWNQGDSSAIHLMRNFGGLIFDNTVPAIAANAIPVFEANKSTFLVQSSQPMDVNATIKADKTTQSFQATGNGKITLPLASDTPKVLFQWSARSGEKYFYRSPALEISTQSSLAHLRISTAKSWKLYLNGALKEQGNAAHDQDVAFPLVDGINDIVVEAESGQAKLQLTPPLFTPPGDVFWRTHEVGDAKVLLETDRSSWKIAPVTNNDIGTAGAPALFQHTLLYKSTFAYPVTSPAFYVAQGTAQQLTFLAEGVKGIRLENWQVTLAIPSEFEVLGSSGFYGNPIKGKEKFTTEKSGTTTIEGKELSVYKITADKPISYRPNQMSVLVSFEVLVRLPSSVDITKNPQWNFYYWTDANNHAVSETPQQFAVRALPPLNGKQPKKFVWEFWTSNARLPQYDDAKMVKDILDTSRQAGFNAYQASSDKEFSNTVRSYGMKAFSNINFNMSQLTSSIKPYLEAHPQDRLVDKEGKPNDTYMCTSEVLEQNWPMYEKWLVDYVKDSGADIVDYDYEIPPFSPVHACFDDRCLTAFREFANLNNTEITRETILQDYREQWIDFMAHRAAMLLRKMKDAVHQADSNVQFSAYSGYYNAKNDTTKVRYGIDWNSVGEMQSVDKAGMGYGRPIPGITDSVEALRGIPAIFGELLTPYDLHSRQPVAPILRSTLIRRALDATAGVLIYARNSMDGRSWTAVADVSRLTADYEDVFLNKTVTDVPGQDSASVQIAKGAGKTLLCVMNLSHTKESTFSIEIPTELANGKEYYSGNVVRAGQKLEIKLAPGDARVYVFGD